MMATEANQSKSVDAVITSSEPAITISPDSDNVDHKQPLVNGAAASEEIENKQLSDIVDDLVNSTEVSISGGSDTEASRNDGAHPKNGEKGHARSSSTVKKPATFKTVSVNKTFLGSKGSASGSSSKAGEKPTSASPLSAGQTVTTSGATATRPRFVAKFGSGMRDGVKTSASLNGKGASAPDASAVWNKNRPPPAPEPKKLTDEELKKYGIHMANRLAPDDARGPGNWADIDDDDEDWNPEEIQWNDGTKVTIPQVDESAASPTPAPAAPVKTSTPPVPAEFKHVDKPKSPAPAPSPSIKPGVLGSGKGLVLKGAPEKPTLVARPPPPPAPVKSPWAPLPPIDKASPAALDAPAAHTAGRLPPRDGPFAKSMTPPPAKEIAADDFSRSSGPPNPNRELFNSQSGRYEPVTDRRMSGRSEAQSRHPATVLQRPSQSEGPAEPSAAFQTSRTSGQDVPYGRRRGSSNVSGGSGTYYQRMGPKPHDGVLPPPDVLQARRESFTAVGDSPISPRNFSPAGARHQGPPWQNRASPRAHYAVPHPAQHNAVPHDYQQPHQQLPPTAQPPPPPAPTEDEFQLQKRLMAEKRELARQRRQEEEARLEAEKQQRIAAKLAALGPAPESRSAKAAAKDEASSTAVPPVAPGTSGTLPSSSEVQQRPDSKPGLARPSGDGPVTDPSVNGGRAVAQSSKAQKATDGDGRGPPIQEGKSSQAWQGSVPSQPDRFSWGSGTQSSSRIWAAPSSSNRSLGNGTFNSELGRVPDAFSAALDPVSAKSRPGPGPIGPPGGSKAYGNMPKPIGPPKPTASDYSSRPRATGADDERARWANATIAADEKAAAESRERFAQQKRDLDARGVAADEARPNLHESWKPVKFDSDGRRLESKERVQVVHGSASWKPSPDDQKQPPTAQPPQTPISVSPPSAHGAIGSAQPRSSRFFPTRDVRTELPVSHDRSRHHSPSPPPPDTVGHHPAFDGDATHPHVALPPSRPVVRLPPSTSAAAVHGATDPALTTVSSSQPFDWANPAPYKDAGPSEHAQARGSSGATAHPPQQQPGQSNWQDKINHLLHDSKPSAQHKAMHVDSSSRSTLEPGHVYSQATVFLPFAAPAGANDSSTTSKAMAETCFEEQEMGSLPPVRLPTTVAEAAWHPAQPPAKPFPRRFVVVPHTVDPVYEEPRPARIVVRAPGMASSKSVPLAHNGRSYSNPRRTTRPRNPSARHIPSSHGSHRGSGGGSGVGNGGNRSRDASVSFSADHGPNQTAASGSGPAGGASAGHGSTGRGRGSGFRRPTDWSRRASTPVQT